MEISRRDSEFRRPAHEANTELVTELEILFGGTKTFGRTVTEGVVVAWRLALRRSDVTLAELQIAVEWWVSKVGGETPEPRALIAWIESKREDIAVNRMLREVAEEAQVESEIAVRDFRERHGTTDASPEERVAVAKQVVMGAGLIEETEEEGKARRIALRSGALPLRRVLSLPSPEDPAHIARVAAQVEAMKAGQNLMQQPEPGGNSGA